MPFVVILDACTLFPASLRDTLLTAAELNLYEIRLTDEILEEVRRNLAQKRMDEENALKIVMTIRAPLKNIWLHDIEHLSNICPLTRAIDMSWLPQWFPKQIL